MRISDWSSDVCYSDLMQGTHACVLLLAFRDGRNLGTRAFFPKTNGSDSPAEVLAAFVSQYYGEQLPPREIILDREIEDVELLQDAFSAAAGRRVQVKTKIGRASWRERVGQYV